MTVTMHLLNETVESHLNHPLQSHALSLRTESKFCINLSTQVAYLINHASKMAMTIALIF